MPRSTRMKILFFAPRDKFQNILVRQREIFKDVKQIASSVDWNFRYAFYKPIPPTREEIENFTKMVEAVKRELALLKRTFKPVDTVKLKVVEEKLNNIVDDYKNYPFSDREIFFQARLKFLRQTIKKCFVK